MNIITRISKYLYQRGAATANCEDIKTLSPKDRAAKMQEFQEQITSLRETIEQRKKDQIPHVQFELPGEAVEAVEAVEAAPEGEHPLRPDVRLQLKDELDRLFPKSKYQQN